MKVIFSKLSAPLILSVFSLTTPGNGLSLQQYAEKNKLTVYKIPGKGLPLERSDQDNNLVQGDKVLALSKKGLDDISGISTLTVIDDGKRVPITQVKNLQIFLNNNNLKSLPSEIAKMKNVNFIYLKANAISTLPSEIGQMTGLIGLYFPKNNVSEIPESIFTLPNLKKLEGADNKIREISESIGNLTNLVHLNFGGNLLETLPSSIGKVKNLRVCDFSRNHLKKLPEDFGNSKFVHELRLSDNPDLKELPKSLVNMQGALRIDGTGIDVKKLPPVLQKKTTAKRV